MQLQLEDLAYQRQAIDAVVGLFAGQPRNSYENALFYGIRANLVTLSQEEINQNKQRVIAENGISQEAVALDDSIDYCIEMETGTGKTLVYIRTAYELLSSMALPSSSSWFLPSPSDRG